MAYYTRKLALSCCPVYLFILFSPCYIILHFFVISSLFLFPCVFNKLWYCFAWKTIFSILFFCNLLADMQRDVVEELSTELCYRYIRAYYITRKSRVLWAITYLQCNVDDDGNAMMSFLSDYL